MNPIEIANEQIKKRPSMYHEKNDRYGRFTTINGELAYIDKYNDTLIMAKDFHACDTRGICEGTTNMMFLNHLKKNILKETQ